jgi:hypothetical protein
MYRVWMMLSVCFLFLCLGLYNKYLSLSDKYLRSADQVGKSYAILCHQHEEACMQFLQKSAELSEPADWIGWLLFDKSLEKRYNLRVLKAFEKEIGL